MQHGAVSVLSFGVLESLYLVMTSYEYGAVWCSVSASVQSALFGLWDRVVILGAGPEGINAECTHVSIGRTQDNRLPSLAKSRSTQAERQIRTSPSSRAHFHLNGKKKKKRSHLGGADALIN